MSLNKVTLIGKLGADPEMRTTQNGDKIANFSIATSERWTDKSGEKQEKTEWHKIVVFSKGLAGVCESYLKKGSQVYIEGQLKTRKWTDSSGNEKYTTEIVLSSFNSVLLMIGSKNESSAPQEAKAEDLDDRENSIPF